MPIQLTGRSLSAWLLEKTPRAPASQKEATRPKRVAYSPLGWILSKSLPSGTLPRLNLRGTGGTEASGDAVQAQGHV